MSAVLTIAPEVAHVIDQIVVRFRPSRILLFGSHATGTADPESDVDILVVMETSLRPVRQAAAISREIDHRVPVDLVVRTPAQLASPDPGDLLLRTILREHVVAHDSGR